MKVSAALLTRLCRSSSLCRTTTTRRAFASPTALAIKNREIDKDKQELEESKNPAQRRLEFMRADDKAMIFGDSEDSLPAVPLPENPAEVSALDPAHRVDMIQPDGRERLVHIRQPESTVGQSADNDERFWIISFMQEGEAAATWDNPLMGWTSGADPMASNIQLQMSFRTAKDAVYFAQKRGWNFIVDKPILKAPGDTNSKQYQDNFLPKAIAKKVKAERTQCSHWERPKAGASHYMRPLKYHGDGEVPQYGSNPTAKVAPHVESYYKMR